MSAEIGRQTYKNQNIGIRWEIKNCMLIIQHATEEKMKYSFRLVRFQGDKIYLRDTENKTDAVYKRIKQ